VLAIGAIYHKHKSFLKQSIRKARTDESYIVACGLLRKEGYDITFARFMTIGIPFTLAAVLPAYLFIWLVRGM
jgi:hypothetical protein